jgi:hypothetical protein
VTDLNQGRSLLLEVKRRTGVLISKILPGTPKPERTGIARYDLGLRIGGSGASLVEFVRAIEDRKEPVRITPVMLRGTEFGPEMALRLRFLSYRPLSERNPAVWAAVNSRGRGPDFEQVRREYLKTISNAGDRPWAPPDWGREPFGKPVEEKK